MTDVLPKEKPEESKKLKKKKSIETLRKMKPFLERESFEYARKDLAKKLFELAGVNPIFEMLSAPQCSVKRRCPNIDKIKKLGYSVKYSIEYGLEKTYQSYKDK